MAIKRPTRYLATVPIRLVLLLLLLLVGMAALSTVIFVSGVDETTLALQTKRRDLTVDELAADHAGGWVAVYGCVRHDLAVGVNRARGPFRLGSTELERGRRDNPDAQVEADRVFTPLSALDDCDEERPPTKIFALIEDDDTLGDTISFAYRSKVLPPPVKAIVSGVVGHGAGHGSAASKGRSFLAQSLKLDLDGRPLLVKGKQPGVRWVAMLTLAAGAHGYLLCVLLVVWAVRRTLRQRAILSGQVSEAEEDFFRSETVD